MFWSGGGGIRAPAAVIMTYVSHDTLAQCSKCYRSFSIEPPNILTLQVNHCQYTMIPVNLPMQDLRAQVAVIMTYVYHDISSPMLEMLQITFVITKFWSDCFDFFLSWSTESLTQQRTNHPKLATYDVLWYSSLAINVPHWRQHKSGPSNICVSCLQFLRGVKQFPGHQCAPLTST